MRFSSIQWKPIATKTVWLPAFFKICSFVFCRRIKRSYSFGFKWEWIKNDRIFIFVWTKPSIVMLKCPGSLSVVLLLQQAIWSYQWHMFSKKFVVAAKQPISTQLPKLQFPFGTTRMRYLTDCSFWTLRTIWLILGPVCLLGVLQHSLMSLPSGLFTFPQHLMLILSTWAPPSCLWRCESIPPSITLAVYLM